MVFTRNKGKEKKKNPPVFLVSSEKNEVVNGDN